jgi:thiamine biosynthesis lipoprotein
MPGYRRVEQVMGTAVSLLIADPLPDPTLAKLGDQVFGWLHEVDARFSTYQPDSEVNRLDRGELDRAGCSADLRAVLDVCGDLWRETDGYFDAYATGRLDPSGYVKGWSVQVASDRLVEAGSVHHCLNAGGDVRMRGRPAPGQEWQVGIRHPWEADKLCWVLAGTDFGVATSGTYERGYHVVDPYRGKPATALRSVTVVGPDLGLADAYATAALAMGLAGLDWLAGRSGYECGVVTGDGLSFRSAGLPVVTPQPA